MYFKLSDLTYNGDFLCWKFMVRYSEAGILGSLVYVGGFVAGEAIMKFGIHV